MVIAMIKQVISKRVIPVENWNSSKTIDISQVSEYKIYAYTNNSNIVRKIHKVYVELKAENPTVTFTRWNSIGFNDSQLLGMWNFRTLKGIVKAVLLKGYSLYQFDEKYEFFEWAAMVVKKDMGEYEK